MTSPNGNMTSDERRALQPGAVVSYRSERMLSEIQGTVDAVRCSGRLALCDGAFVFSCDYCRLISAAPMPLTQPDVRGFGDDDPEQDAPKTPGGSPHPSGDKPGRDRRQMARKCGDCGKSFEGAASSHYCPKCRRARQSKGPGGKRADRELWRAAVLAVDSYRDRGMTTAQAVAMAGRGDKFAELKLTVGNYRLWRRQLEPGEVVLGAAMAKAPAADLAAQPEAMRRQLGVAQRRSAELSADLNAAMEALASVRTELAQRPVTLAGRTDDDMRLMELVLGGQPRT